MSVTPRTTALEVHIRTRHEYQKTDHQLWREHSDQLEIDLNAAKQVALNFMREVKSLNNSLVAADERIKRLEKALVAADKYIDEIQADDSVDYHTWVVNVADARTAYNFTKHAAKVRDALKEVKP